MATINDKKYIKDGDLSHFGKALLNKQIQKTTWSNLKDARDSSILIPGCVYRITDYYCTSMDDNAKSAGHRFDILVEATDVNTLSEICKCCKHEFADDEIDPLTGAVYTQEEKDYFNDIPIEAWEVHYCLDNDQQRFNWAVEGFGLNITTASGSCKLQFNSPLTTTLGISGKYAYTNILGNSSYTQCYLVTKSAPANLTVGDTIELYDITNSTVLSTETITNLEYTGIRTTLTPSISAYLGRGVIYRLIDEHNNDVCYDFKNILFKRDADWRTTYSGYYDTNVFNSEHEWFYTFNGKGVNINLDTSNTSTYNNVIKDGKSRFRLPNSLYFSATSNLYHSYSSNVTIVGGITTGIIKYCSNIMSCGMSARTYCLTLKDSDNIVTKAFSRSVINSCSNITISDIWNTDNVIVNCKNTTFNCKGVDNKINFIENSTINASTMNSCYCKGMGGVTLSGTNSGRILNLNIVNYIYNDSPTPISIIIPANDDFRAMNLDTDANGNPIIYFPSDQEELIENMTATTATLYPKRMYVWGTVASLDLSLASTGSSVVNEYHFRFTADSGMTLSLPSGITWANGTVPPRTQGKTYEISIIGNYASYLEF